MVLSVEADHVACVKLPQNGRSLDPEVLPSLKDAPANGAAQSLPRAAEPEAVKKESCSFVPDHGSRHGDNTATDVDWSDRSLQTCLDDVERVGQNGRKGACQETAKEANIGRV